MIGQSSAIMASVEACCCRLQLQWSKVKLRRQLETPIHRVNTQPTTIHRKQQGSHLSRSKARQTGWSICGPLGLRLQWPVCAAATVSLIVPSHHCSYTPEEATENNKARQFTRPMMPALSEAV